MGKRGAAPFSIISSSPPEEVSRVKEVRFINKYRPQCYQDYAIINPSSPEGIYSGRRISAGGGGSFPGRTEAP